MFSCGARVMKVTAFCHCAGVVIGEEAVVGDHVTIMQHVTLGGTGSVRGDRHPKIGDYVQIGVKATILGAPCPVLPLLPPQKHQHKLCTHSTG